jgi:hypothetical protein
MIPWIETIPLSESGEDAPILPWREDDGNAPTNSPFRPDAAVDTIAGLDKYSHISRTRARCISIGMLIALTSLLTHSIVDGRSAIISLTDLASSSRVWM